VRGGLSAHGDRARVPGDHRRPAGGCADGRRPGDGLRRARGTSRPRVGGHDRVRPARLSRWEMVMADHPVLMHTALDATDCRGLAEFYRQFLGLHYRPGDDIPTDGPDDANWLV